MANATHGQVVGKILYKRGTQVVKFWKHNGYAVPAEEFGKYGLKGVKLYTKYDGRLYATRETFDKHAIPHLFTKPDGTIEHQLILPIQFWEVVD